MLGLILLSILTNRGIGSLGAVVQVFQCLGGGARRNTRLLSHPPSHLSTYRTRVPGPGLDRGRERESAFALCCPVLQVMSPGSAFSFSTLCNLPPYLSALGIS